MVHYSNGNGTATRMPVITGQSLVHRQLTKKQRAVLAADVADGVTRYEQMLNEIARSFGISVAYLGIARGLSPAKRNAILQGLDLTSFTKLLSLPHQPALPAPTIDPAHLSDTQLERVIRSAGVERVLNVAAAVEHCMQ
jgi:hypothetical protein